MLEPGAGAGTFIGMAPGSAEMVGAELDPTTAAIAAALYPDATIRTESFADTPLVDGALREPDDVEGAKRDFGGGDGVADRLLIAA